MVGDAQMLNRSGSIEACFNTIRDIEVQLGSADSEESIHALRTGLKIEKDALLKLIQQETQPLTVDEIIPLLKRPNFFGEIENTLDKAEVDAFTNQIYYALSTSGISSLIQFTKLLYLQLQFLQEDDTDRISKIDAILLQAKSFLINKQSTPEEYTKQLTQMPTLFEDIVTIFGPDVLKSITNNLQDLLDTCKKNNNLASYENLSTAINTATSNEISRLQQEIATTLDGFNFFWASSQELRTIFLDYVSIALQISQKKGLKNSSSEFFYREDPRNLPQDIERSFSKLATVLNKEELEAVTPLKNQLIAQMSFRDNCTKIATRPQPASPKNVRGTEKDAESNAVSQKNSPANDIVIEQATQPTMLTQTSLTPQNDAIATTTTTSQAETISDTNTTLVASPANTDYTITTTTTIVEPEIAQADITIESTPLSPAETVDIQKEQTSIPDDIIISSTGSTATTTINEPVISITVDEKNVENNSTAEAEKLTVIAQNQQTNASPIDVNVTTETKVINPQEENNQPITAEQPSSVTLTSTNDATITSTPATNLTAAPVSTTTTAEVTIDSQSAAATTTIVNETTETVLETVTPIISVNQELQNKIAALEARTNALYALFLDSELSKLSRKIFIDPIVPTPDNTTITLDKALENLLQDIVTCEQEAPKNTQLLSVKSDCIYLFKAKININNQMSQYDSLDDNQTKDKTQLITNAAKVVVDSNDLVSESVSSKIDALHKKITIHYNNELLIKTINKIDGLLTHTNKRTETINNFLEDHTTLNKQQHDKFITELEALNNQLTSLEKIVNPKPITKRAIQRHDRKRLESDIKHAQENIVKTKEKCGKYLALNSPASIRVQTTQPSFATVPSAPVTATSTTVTNSSQDGDNTPPSPSSSVPSHTNATPKPIAAVPKATSTNKPSFLQRNRAAITGALVGIGVVCLGACIIAALIAGSILTFGILPAIIFGAVCVGGAIAGTATGVAIAKSDTSKAAIASSVVPTVQPAPTNQQTADIMLNLDDLDNRLRAAQLASTNNQQPAQLKTTRDTSGTPPNTPNPKSTPVATPSPAHSSSNSPRSLKKQ